MKKKLLLFTLAVICMLGFAGCNKGSGKIQYELSANKTHYIVKGIGSYTDTNLVIPEEYKGVPVECIGNNAFLNCTNLVSVTLPNSITRIISSAFSGCTNLTNITIPNSVKNIGDNAFSNCTSLATITLPTDIISIESSLFSGCTSLTSITIPSNVTSIGVYAFKGCTKLASITIPSKVISIGVSAFEKCIDLATITVDTNNSIYDSRDNCNAIIEKATNSLVVGCKTTVIPDNVVTIRSRAFFDCTNLAEISIPDNVKVIEGTAFGNCINLENITFGASSKLNEIGNSVFNGCTKLASINIPTSVKTLGNSVFNGCAKLTSIEIPASVKEIGENVFGECTSLTSIVVNASNLTYDSRNNCNAIIKTSTNTLVTGCSTTTIPNDVTKIADKAFINCTNLVSITIPSSVISIGSLVFSNCTSLNSVTFENTENWSLFEETTTSGVSVVVTDANQNAINLKGIYVNRTWKCQ